MRTDPDRLRFEIDARDGAARTGQLHTAHGPVATPAFIPLATRGSVRALTLGEVAELGYELVLGNTFHLFLRPGAERIAELRRAARVHGLGAGDHHRLRRLPGLLARPRQRRRRDQGQRGGAGSGRRRARDLRGGRRASAPTSTARERFMGPEESM